MRPTSIYWICLVFAVVAVFATIVPIILGLKVFLPDLFDSLKYVAEVSNILVLLAVVVAILEYRRQLKFDRTQQAFDRTVQAVEFMLQYYNNERLDSFRKVLRNWEDGYSPFEPDGSLKDDVVLGMNYFEALSIAVAEGVFDAKIVERMLGTVICEFGRHPMKNILEQDRFSYENLYNLLLPEIKRIRSNLRKDRYDE